MTQFFPVGKIKKTMLVEFIQKNRQKIVHSHAGKMLGNRLTKSTSNARIFTELLRKSQWIINQTAG